MKFKFDFPLTEEINVKTLKRPQKLKYKFCKYAGLDPNIVVIESDINEHWNDAFQRVMLEEGATEQELRKVLIH